MDIAFLNFQSAQSVEVYVPLFQRSLVVPLLTCHPIKEALGEMHRSNFQRQNAWTFYAVLTICREYQRAVFEASVASHRPRQGHIYQSFAMTEEGNNHSVVCSGVMATKPNPLGMGSNCSIGKPLQFLREGAIIYIPVILNGRYQSATSIAKARLQVSACTPSTCLRPYAMAGGTITHLSISCQLKTQW